MCVIYSRFIGFYIFKTHNSHIVLWNILNTSNLFKTWTYKIYWEQTRLYVNASDQQEKKLIDDSDPEVSWIWCCILLNWLFEIYNRIWIFWRCPYQLLFYNNLCSISFGFIWIYLNLKISKHLSIGSTLKLIRLPWFWKQCLVITQVWYL